MIKLTRAQRREMKKLGDKADRMSQADRLYFERRPDRQHRVRPSHPAEIRRREIIRGKPLTLPPGLRWFTVVKNVFPGARLHLCVGRLEGAETDLSEPAARQVWEAAATP